MSIQIFKCQTYLSWLFFLSPFFLIGPEWLPRFNLMPCLLSMRNTELRLLKPLALHTSSMGWPETYRLMTVFSLSSFCIFADETGGGDTIIFSCKLTTCSADLRRARTSSGKTSITFRCRTIIFPRNTTFVYLSIWLSVIVDFWKCLGGQTGDKNFR